MTCAMKLYTYWRSSSAYRVRIALNLQGLDYEPVPVHLVRDGGEQHLADYRALNPMGLVPTLVDGDKVITESLAIIEYLDECHPAKTLLPADPYARARVRSIALTVACGIQPLNNLNVISYITGILGADESAKDGWYRHWIDRGFAALEKTLAASSDAGKFCYGDRPTLADVCLVPQVYNAVRFQCNLSGYPLLMGIHHRCQELEAFVDAAPENQPDAES